MQIELPCCVNQKLNRLFERLEVQRHELLEKVKHVPDKFDVRPNDKKWSIHQLLAHLIAAEKLSNQYISKKIQGIDQAGDTGLLEELKMMVLKASQRLPLKFNAPQPVVASTDSYSNLTALIAEWDATREDFKQLLSQVKDDQLKRKVYKHVIAGKLNIVHAVEFLHEHVAHHLPQVNRLLN